ncbi:MAG TPA: hypothetical protein VHO70_07550 [Chitinispirillaceae bacterium]|nr:hypothetical protein [Chitinispirillaceae bacterium]
MNQAASSNRLEILLNIARFTDHFQIKVTIRCRLPGPHHALTGYAHVLLLIYVISPVHGKGAPLLHRMSLSVEVYRILLVHVTPSLQSDVRFVDREFIKTSAYLCIRSLIRYYDAS